MGCLFAVLQPALDRHAELLASRRLLLVPALTLFVPLLQFLSNRLYLVVGLTSLHFGIALSLEHVVRRRYAALNCAPLVWLGVMS